MSVISYTDLPKIRGRHKNEKIVFCSGSFDLPHSGHILFIKNCKKYGDILVVGVGKDRDIKNNKGKGRPVLGETDRLAIVDALRYTDYTLLTESPTPGDHYLSPLHKIFSLLKPDIYVFNNDASYAKKRETYFKKHNITIKVLERDPSLPSTTHIIEKIRKTEK